MILKTLIIIGGMTLCDSNHVKILNYQLKQVDSLEVRLDVALREVDKLLYRIELNKKTRSKQKDEKF